MVHISHSCRRCERCVIPTPTFGTRKPKVGPATKAPDSRTPGPSPAPAFSVSPAPVKPPVVVRQTSAQRAAEAAARRKYDDGVAPVLRAEKISVTISFTALDTNVLLSNPGELMGTLQLYEDRRNASIARYTERLRVANQQIQDTADGSGSGSFVDISCVDVHCDCVVLAVEVIHELNTLKHRKSDVAVAKKAQAANRECDKAFAKSNALVPSARDRATEALSWAKNRLPGETATKEHPARNYRRKLLRAIDVLKAVPLLEAQAPQNVYVSPDTGYVLPSLSSDPAALKHDDAILNCCLFFHHDPFADGGARAGAWGIERPVDVDGRIVEARFVSFAAKLRTNDVAFRNQAKGLRIETLDSCEGVPFSTRRHQPGAPMPPGNVAVHLIKLPPGSSKSKATAAAAGLPGFTRSNVMKQEGWWNFKTPAQAKAAIPHLLIAFPGSEHKKKKKKKDKHKALIDATKAEDLETMKSLLADGANVNYQTERKQYTALHYASYQGFNDGVRLLLEYAANTELVNCHGEIAAAAAAAGNHQEISAMLASTFDC